MVRRGSTSSSIFRPISQVGYYSCVLVASSSIFLLCCPSTSFGYLLHSAATTRYSRAGHRLFAFNSNHQRSSSSIHARLLLAPGPAPPIRMPPSRRRRPTSSKVLSSAMGASSTATNNSNSKADVDADADVELFRKWVSHSDMSFHSFDETTATNIRKDLLVWYREHRRKLPWRSDPPPYDGSTAGINNNNNNSTKKKQTAKEKASQSNKKITNFFQANSKTSKNATASSSSSSKAKESTTPKSEDSSTIQLPDPATSLSSSSTANIPIPAAAAAAAVSAYGVWVSEIMLQQTRVEAVIPYWIRWMTNFPTVHALAEATEEQVNAHWAGLGFYRRARLLHQGAKLIVSDYQGEIPGTVEELLKITGIGPYTASAVASIAFDVCVPVVDGNVCRVLSRLTGIANHIKAPALKDKQGWELASQLVHAGDQTCAGEVNQALMELGATYCAPSGTGIDPRDPLKGYYYSTRLAKAYLTIRQNDDGAFLSELSATESQSCACPLCDSSGIRVVLDELEERIQDAMILEDAMKEGHSIFPLDPPKAKRKEEDLAMAVISNVHDGEVWWLLIRRPAKGLLAGQWEFPSVCVEHRQEGQTKPPTPGAAKRRKALTQYLDTGVMTNGEQHWWTTQSTRKPGVPASLEHIFSHVKHIMWLETMTMEEDLSTIQWKTEEGRDVRWMRESDMKEVGITSGVKKVLKAVQSSQLQSKSTTSTKKRKR